MWRKAAALTVVAALALASLSVCPAGNCSALTVGSAHDCCTRGPGLKSVGCCQSAAELAAPWLSSFTAERPGIQPVTLLRVASVDASPAGAIGWAIATAVGVGPPPPTSLLAQQTSLLL
jgi:hypothetical protein